MVHQQLATADLPYTNQNKVMALWPAGLVVVNGTCESMTNTIPLDVCIVSSFEPEKWTGTYTITSQQTAEPYSYVYQNLWSAAQGHSTTLQKVSGRFPCKWELEYRPIPGRSLNAQILTTEDEILTCPDSPLSDVPTSWLLYDFVHVMDGPCEDHPLVQYVLASTT